VNIWQVILTVQFDDGVGTLRLRHHGFEFGDDRVVAIDRRRTAENELLHPRLRGLLQHHQRSGGVQFITFNRFLHGLGHADHRRKMEDIIHFPHRPPQEVAIQNGSDQQFALETGQVVLEPRTQVVQHAHLGPALKVFDDVAADKPRPAGDQNSHLKDKSCPVK
jgi:hypothetical protein